jgi:hypothetical protein
MTPAERKAVAETLREWAAACERDPEAAWWIWPCDLANPLPHARIVALAAWWCASDTWPGPPDCEEAAVGTVAATGLLLAAAMVEAGDGV